MSEKLATCVCRPVHNREAYAGAFGGLSVPLLEKIDSNSCIIPGVRLARFENGHLVSTLEADGSIARFRYRDGKLSEAILLAPDGKPVFHYHIDQQGRWKRNDEKPLRYDEISAICQGIGSTCLATGDCRRAGEYYQILRDFMHRESPPNADGYLAGAHEGLGRAFLGGGKEKEAALEFRRAALLVEKIHGPSSPEAIQFHWQIAELAKDHFPRLAAGHRAAFLLAQDHSLRDSTAEKDPFFALGTTLLRLPDFSLTQSPKEMRFAGSIPGLFDSVPGCSIPTQLREALTGIEGFQINGRTFRFQGVSRTQFDFGSDLGESQIELDNLSFEIEADPVNSNIIRLKNIQGLTVSSGLLSGTIRDLTLTRTKNGITIEFGKPFPPKRKAAAKGDAPGDPLRGFADGLKNLANDFVVAILPPVPPTPIDLGANSKQVGTVFEAVRAYCENSKMDTKGLLRTLFEVFSLPDLLFLAEVTSVSCNKRRLRLEIPGRIDVLPERTSIRLDPEVSLSVEGSPGEFELKDIRGISTSPTLPRAVRKAIEAGFGEEIRFSSFRVCRVLPDGRKTLVFEGDKHVRFLSVVVDKDMNVVHDALGIPVMNLVLNVAGKDKATIAVIESFVGVPFGASERRLFGKCEELRYSQGRFTAIRAAQTEENFGGLSLVLSRVVDFKIEMKNDTFMMKDIHGIGFRLSFDLTEILNTLGIDLTDYLRAKLNFVQVGKAGSDGNRFLSLGFKHPQLIDIAVLLDRSGFPTVEADRSTWIYIGAKNILAGGKRFEHPIQLGSDGMPIIRAKRLLGTVGRAAAQGADSNPRSVLNKGIVRAVEAAEVALDASEKARDAAENVYQAGKAVARQMPAAAEQGARNFRNFLIRNLP